MSSRQLRKLQQQRELEQAKLQARSSDEESEAERVTSTKPKPSLFSTLAALQDGGDEAEDEDGDVDDLQEAAEEKVRDRPTFSPACSPAAKRAKKSKKKKAKNKKPEEKVGPINGADEIDAALQELDIKEPAGSTTEPANLNLDPGYERVCALLGVNTQYLKVGNEMRNLFGKTATANHDDAGGPAGRRARRRQRGQQGQVDLEMALKGHHAPGKGLSELTLRRNQLIQGKDDWPKGTTGGLTMEVVDDKAVDGTVEFRFVHDQTYQDLQQAFYGFVEMGDPQNLIGLLARNRMFIPLHCF